MSVQLNPRPSGKWSTTLKWLKQAWKNGQSTELITHRVISLHEHAYRERLKNWKEINKR